MPEGQILGLNRPFVEEEEDTIKIIVEYAEIVTKEELRNRIQLVVTEIEDKGFVVSDARVDAGVTPFLVLEMATNNIRFSDLSNIRDIFIDVEGFKALTVSTVDISKVERLTRKR